MHDIDKYKPTERFSNRAKHYSKARPDYPADALDYIVSHCGLSEGARVCDIGSGTGISTRALASRNLQMVGVEPNVAMLDEAKSHPDYAAFISYAQASAENTGLESGSFDALICAQAFHWFEPNKALAEFVRILKEHGWVCLIWNERNESDAFTKAYGDLLRSWPDTVAVESQRHRSGQPLFSSELFQHAEKRGFANEQVMSLEKLIGRALSASYAPPPESPEARQFSQKLEELFQTYSIDSEVVMKYECAVYTAQKR